MRKCAKQGDDLKNLNKKLDPELARLSDFLVLKCQQMPCGEEEAAEEAKGCLKELRILKIKKAMAELTFEIQEANRQKTRKKLEDILEKFKKLSNELIDLMR
jgi:hypothetical protein